jgi:hypothetical protein
MFYTTKALCFRYGYGTITPLYNRVMTRVAWYGTVGYGDGTVAGVVAGRVAGRLAGVVGCLVAGGR